MQILNELVIKRFSLYTLKPSDDSNGNVVIILPKESGQLLTEDNILKLLSAQLELSEEGNIPGNKIFGTDDEIDLEGDVVTPGIKIPIEAIPKIPPSKIEREFFFDEYVIREHLLDGIDDEGFITMTHNLNCPNYYCELYDENRKSIGTVFDTTDPNEVKIYVRGISIREGMNNDDLRLCLLGYTDQAN